MTTVCYITCSTWSLIVSTAPRRPLIDTRHWKVWLLYADLAFTHFCHPTVAFVGCSGGPYGGSGWHTNVRIAPPTAAVAVGDPPGSPGKHSNFSIFAIPLWPSWAAVGDPMEGLVGTQMYLVRHPTAAVAVGDPPGSPGKNSNFNNFRQPTVAFVGCSGGPYGVSGSTARYVPTPKKKRKNTGGCACYSGWVSR